MLILRSFIAALHSGLAFVYLRKMNLLNRQVVENFWELVLSIFDCFLVIDYVEDPEICELKTFLLYLVIGYHLYLVELGKYLLLLTNALFFCIFILS